VRKPKPVRGMAMSIGTSAKYAAYHWSYPGDAAVISTDDVIAANSSRAIFFIVG
jgi:hypothetical protein